MDVSWTPRTSEDLLLERYWRERGGRLYLEVPIGRAGGVAAWPAGSRVRRIDGVLALNSELDDGVFRWSEVAAAFPEQIRNVDLHLIEAKQRLDRLTIGQVIVGQDMFELDYPGHGVITPVALVAAADPAMRRVCERRGIAVEILEPGSPH